ncbi:ATP-binding protein [Pseudoduganella ginsengisoli]|uniref:C4-dicarboxylate transport sensor protein DctB n=1 Tax=Pseudoduganella ginsengisoli TaxID=1462440 RepID=A0A6L6PUH4_9BURK|nr:ATP-binding protein [Pseudoduganella ginsengisoli]MTW00658.1 sensor histidine kinase [Pseudoduganella ginsengisoli]
MRTKPHTPLTSLAIIAALLLVAGAYALGALRARADLLEQGGRQLELMAPDLQSAIDKYETLPFVLGFQPDLAEAIAHPGDAAIIARLNRTLQTIQRQSQVGAIYLMDRSGLTLGSSNWDQPTTFVGKNFSYRPYFSEAQRGRPGLFYGIGTATAEAGYFIAQPVYRDSTDGGPVAGVVAVKISLADFEQTWRSSEHTIALADRHGVIFLSNQPDWRYRSLRPLDKGAQQELAQTQQYAGQHIASLPQPLPEYAVRPVGKLGWQLMLFPSQVRVQRAALLSAAGMALLLACGGALWWALHQRRRRLEEQKESRAALRQAARDLELRIAERTAQLQATNSDLEGKYAKLQQTEHMLRTTQNELVQAGKLAMLGQMAAGITHELNQPLAAIRAFADNARTFLARGRPEQADANLGHISDASARMGAIISQLKGFARKDEAITQVNLARSVQASALLVDNDFKRRGVALETGDIGGNSITVAGDAVRIEQVLINLLRNALDAVAGMEESHPRAVTVTLARADGWAEVRISDTGPGIPEQVAAHLFEPFYTTKPSGQGLGLGLAISSSIVQAMNGQLAAQNLPQGGAQFILRLPLQANEP